MSWVALALASAAAGAGTGAVLKRAVAVGGVLATTVGYRLLAGLLLLAVVAGTGGWPATGPDYWRAVALVLPPEVLGTACFVLALRSGELSVVQPIFGLLPVFVAIGGALVLGEIPAPQVALGIVGVAAGVWCVGAGVGAGGLLAPLRALARSRASWWAVGGALAWSATAVIHKLGIAAVGPFPWGATLALGSSLTLALALPALHLRTGSVGVPHRGRGWALLVGGAAVLFAAQQLGLHLALRAAQAGAVTAVTATSILGSVALGVLWLGERGGAGSRLVGAALVCGGAALIALAG